MTYLKKLTVYMAPFPKARPRVTGRGTFMPKKYTQAKNELLKQFGSVGTKELLKLTCVFVRKMPKSWSINKRNDYDGKFCTAGGDIDNLFGGVMDALFVDDSIVVELSGVKLWGSVDEIRITIEGY